jgi:hypothetical protein
LVFSGIAFMLTFQFDEPLPTYTFGPAAWPRALLVGIAVAAMCLLISTDPGKTAATSAGDTAAHHAQATHRQIILKRLGLFILPLAYVFVMDRIGFLLVTPLFLIVYMYVLGVRSRTTLIWVPLLIYGVVVLLFVKLLFTPLPQGSGVFYSLNGEIINLIQ